jgi:hypothetical protein
MKISIIVLGMGWLCVDLTHGRRQVSELKSALFFYQPQELEQVKEYLPQELYYDLMEQLTAAEVDGRLSRYGPEEDRREVLNRLARLLAANRLPDFEFPLLKLHELGQKHIAKFKEDYPYLDLTIYSQ